MEKIKINEIVKMKTKKGKDFWVVKFSSPDWSPEKAEATIGDWDNQLADYIEHDVGSGGTVSVLIEKRGEYTNITKVDMKSAVKGEVVSDHIEGASCPVNMDDRSKSIVAQCLTKVFCRNQAIPADEPKFVLDAYNYFLGEL